MASEIPLPLHTVYADLVDRCASAAFDMAFAEDGVFTSKMVRGRRYWYFQDRARKQQYVGAETPELLEQIKAHKEVRGEQRDRRSLVSTLVRSAHLPRPAALVGRVVQALADSGVFRLRGVLVGTVAYQTYAAMLGTRLPAASVQTGDIDIAQFRNVSIAVGDKIPPMLDTLQQVDPSFRGLPNAHDKHSVTSYSSKTGLRVDFLTPNRGPDSDAPAHLPALRTDAQQLRFLDFLIHDPEPAVLLHGEGVYVLVPSPERYAVHKLIVATRRQLGAAKGGKDLKQAEALLTVLAQKRPHELKAVWAEAFGRGTRWRQFIGEGLGQIGAAVRDSTLRAVEAPRSVIPGLQLTFSAPRARYDPHREVATFNGQAAGNLVRCAVSREALSDHFGARGPDREAYLRAVRENRAALEDLARSKYLTAPVEDADSVLVTSKDVEAAR